MMRVISLAALLWFLGTGSGAVQTAGMVALQIPPGVRVYAGEAGEIRIGVTIEEGFHVQNSHPARCPGYACGLRRRVYHQTAG